MCTIDQDVRKRAKQMISLVIKIASQVERSNIWQMICWELLNESILFYGLVLDVNVPWRSQRFYEYNIHKDDMLKK